MDLKLTEKRDFSRFFFLLDSHTSIMSAMNFESESSKPLPKYITIYS